MDATQLSRWTRFAAKGGIGKCTALQDCVAKDSDDLMFLKDDEIVVLMQLPEQEDVYLGYCEGVVGQFQGRYVRFHSKLKTPVMTKRGSTSKSPRSSVVASSSQRYTASQSPVPSLARAASREDNISLRAFVSSPPTVPKRLSFVAPLPIDPPPSDMSLVAETSSGSVDVTTLVAPSTSYSSSSSAQESASPQTPSDFRLEPVAKADPGDRADDLTPSAEHTPQAAERDRPPSPVAADPSLTQDVTADEIASHRISRISVALSDGVSGIGLSLLQDFITGGDGDSSDSDLGSDSDARPGSRNSFSSTVGGFPAPPTFTPISLPVAPPTTKPGTPPPVERTQSPTSMHDGDEWEGASDIYDNYRYSRMSVSSKMSKSSGQGGWQEAPPPVPSDLRPSMDRTYSSDAMSVRQPSMDSHSSLASPRSPTFPNMVPASGSIFKETKATPAALNLGGTKLRPAPLELPAPSPLLHTSFGSPMSSPGLPTTSGFTATSPSFASGAASALRQRLEVEREPVHVPSPTQESTTTEHQDIVVEDDEDHAVPAPTVLEWDSPPTSPHPDQSFASSSTSMSEKRRGGPASPLVVVNQAPPPPYTPLSPPMPPVQAGPSPISPIAATFNAMPTPSIPAARPRPPKPEQPGSAQPSREEMFGSARTSIFLPHPNAPKPSPTSQGPMYGRNPATQNMPAAAPAGSLIPTLQTACAPRFGPNGRPRLNTIYGITDHDLSESLGPVVIRFSLDPPNDIPANRYIPKRTTTLAAIPASGDVLEEQKPAEQQQEAGPSTLTTSNSTPIPRANFFPRMPAARPRSRSFSGFDTQLVPGTAPKERSREEPVGREATQREVNPRASTASGRRASSRTRQYTPSPLALSTAVPRAPPSPLSAVSPAPPTPTSPRPAVSVAPRTRSLGPSQSDAASPPMPPSPISPASEGLGLPKRKSSLPSSPISPSSVPSEFRSYTPPNRSGLSNDGTSMARASRSSLRRRTSVDTDVSNHSDARSVTSPIPASSSGVVRNTSLRSKLSLSALRAKSSTQNFRDEKPTFEDAAQRDNETVQVEDLDFELVRPSIPAARASEDSSIYGRSSINGDAKADRPTFLRAESPASSTSGFPLRSPASGSEKGIPQPRGATVEAHRARELKWISAMASTPSSQARKSKKIRKLLQDGVPASVRYQVWAHLTDSKAKRIDGLYGQLSKREKVPAFADIERDVRQCFPTDARMSEPGGPIVSLLHAYLSMVPDIQYHKGLAYIAGQLLLQSPEEDAFWIFISLMDTHLRPYFSPNAIQMDVDASLFAKALEVADASVAKKLFVDMSIQPVRVIRPWFSSLFVEALPTEYFQRVWDIFLSEGIVYLIRVGLAILTLCRRVVLDGKGEGQVLNILARPPAILMSSSPDNLIELANSFKVKDDDIRKQRVKMEAQLKRQTQSRLAATAPGQRASAQPPSISLPRA